MQRLIMLMLAFVASMLPAAANAWWQADWPYRKQISVDTTQQAAGIAEHAGRVPMLVRLHTGNFAFDGVSESGADLRFVAADDRTVLNHQIESFDPLLGMALIWVDVPELAGGARQDIWMYYGNQAAPSTANGQLTFDPNYTLVYHFNGPAETPARDTTAYSNHAQTPAAGVVDGVVGRAAQFAGGAPLMLPASPSLAVPAAGAFTFSAWVRADQPAGEQLLYARRDAGNSLLIGLDQSVPFVEVNGQRSAPGQPVTPGAWQHLALTADGSQLVLYVNGKPAATLAAALPPLATAAALGGDVVGTATVVQEDGSVVAAPVSPFQPFVGAMDEIRLSKVARPAALIQADALAQGSESRLVQYGADEEQSSFNLGGLAFLVKSVPLDAWIVIAVLVFMMLQSWVIMVVKNRAVGRVERGNSAFREAFAKVGTRLEMLADSEQAAKQLQDASLWRLYGVAVNELRTRRSQGVDMSAMSAAAIDAIRASMEAARTRESQQLGTRLGTLSNAIAGGPYIGLLGTVLGIMVVFLGTAMAGDVNINAIAPGMAAALLATAMGLFVAIPALFGYNRLAGRNRNVNADMRVFIDEFVTRLAETYAGAQPSPAGRSV